MQKIDRDVFETYKRPRKTFEKSLVLFASVLLLLMTASGAFAVQICSDCHITGPHSSCDPANCSGCHVSQNVYHPSGSGTPSGCAACHTATPHPTVGAGTDLDATCVTSACHGTAGIAHLFTAAQLAPYKTEIHSGPNVLSIDCGDCHGAGGIMPAEHYTPTAICTNCHSRPGVKSTMVLAHPNAIGGPSTACSTCHTVGVKPNEITACANGSCHGPGGIAHLRNDFSTLQVLAKNMHQIGAVTPSTDCLTCHPAEATLKYSMPGTDCTSCHTRPGVIPVTSGTESVCRNCHPTGSYDAMATNIHLTKPTATL